MPPLLRPMLNPAEIEFTPQGPRSVRYEDRYFGEVGALQQARRVFIQGCTLPSAWQGKRHFSILETGFGLGFNFLATWDAWKHDPCRPDRLHFLSIECHPVSLLQLTQAHAYEPQLALLARQLRRNLPPAIAGLHRLEFEQGRVCLTLVYEQDVRALKMLSMPVDAIFLDGFAPERNPAFWSQKFLDGLYQQSKTGTQLSTWCAAGEIRKRLTQSGFEVERGPGIGNQQETTRARRGVAKTDQEHIPSSPPACTMTNSQVMVLGAGLAGTAITERLIQRGCYVSLIDAAQGPGQGASGNLAGIVRPLVSRDDNRSSQFTRAALLYAIQRWERLQQQSHPAWHPTGVLQVARDEAQYQQWCEMVFSHPMPGEWVQLLSKKEAEQRCGFPLKQGGLLFPQAGWAEPKLLCEQALFDTTHALRTHWGQSVHSLKQTKNGSKEWIALDPFEKEIARAPHVIIASGAGPHIDGTLFDDFLPASLRSLQRLRGEVTHFNLQNKPMLDSVICGEGYVCPSPDQTWSVGATYDEKTTLDISSSGIQENTAKLKTLIGISANPEEIQGGRASFRSVAWDRLPIVGKDPEHQGLWHCRALASRGLAWHGIAAELLIAQMELAPPPLEKILCETVSPQRKSIQNPQ